MKTFQNMDEEEFYKEFPELKAIDNGSGIFESPENKQVIIDEFIEFGSNLLTQKGITKQTKGDKIKAAAKELTKILKDKPMELITYYLDKVLTKHAAFNYLIYGGLNLFLPHLPKDIPQTEMSVYEYAPYLFDADGNGVIKIGIPYNCKKAAPFYVDYTYNPVNGDLHYKSATKTCETQGAIYASKNAVRELYYKLNDIKQWFQKDGNQEMTIKMDLFGKFYKIMMHGYRWY